MQFSKILFFCAVFSVIGFIPSMAQASLSLDKVIIKFTPGERPVENITLTNQSTEKVLRVTGSVVKITNSGQETESEAPAKEVVLAPKVVELQPGEQRAVRLVLRGFPDDEEGIYRVRFKPDTPELKEQNFEGGTSVKIGVIVTMGALVMVAPKNPKTDLTFTRTADTLEFVNNGNVTAQLQREEFCDQSRTNCVPLTGKRIYPGMSWSYQLPEGLKSKVFSQTLLMNGQYSTLSFPTP